MKRSILALAVSVLALAWSGVVVAQEVESAVTADHHAHTGHDAATPLPEDQRWATDAPLREAMLRIRDGVTARATAFRESTLSAAEGQVLAAFVEEDVQFMIANCRLAPEPDAALHALIGRMLGAAEALRDDPLSAGGLPQLEAVLNDYGATFDHPGWEAPGA
jgi:hypothetical protein